MDFSSLSSIVTAWPMDWIFIFGFATLMALDAIRTGPARATALVLSLPASLLVMQQLPEAFFLGALFAQYTAPLAQLAIFGAIAVLLYIATHRLIFTFSNGIAPLQALMVGCASAAVVLVVWLHIPALDGLWHFGDQVRAVFGEAYRFWWLMASYVILAASRH